MSTLAATNLKHASSASNNVVLDSSGNTSVGGTLSFNSGYGSSATAYGCRAWVNFNGTGTVAIRASGNVSSITDNGVGDYTVNMTSAMTDVNYCTVASPGDFQTTLTNRSISANNATSSTVRVLVSVSNTNTAADNSQINVSVFR